MWVAFACDSTAYRHYEDNRKVWRWIFICIAIFFNPIVPTFLSREVWQPIDIGAAILFLVNIIYSILKLIEQHSNNI